MRQILIILSLLSLIGCFVSGPKKASSRVLYKGEFYENVIIRISYSNNPDNNLYRILLYEKNKLIEHIEITDIPKGFVIDKTIPSQKEKNNILRMVSDTINTQLRCINFVFPTTYCNQKTLSTFTSITEKEKKILQLFSKVVRETKMPISFSDSDKEKLIGWVQITY